MYSFFQSQGVGDALIRYATEEFGADNLWALEKNKRAISFYQNHGFQVTGRKRRNAFSFLNEKINSI